MSDYENTSVKETAIWAAGIVTIVLIAFGLFAYMVYRVSSNDHANTLKQQRIQVACVQSGQSVISGNCVRIAATP